MRRWQYRVVRHRSLLLGGNSDTQVDPECEAILDRHGEDGWELVSVAVQSYRREYDPTALQGYSFFTYFFKRETT